MTSAPSGFRMREPRAFLVSFNLDHTQNKSGTGKTAFSGMVIGKYTIHVRTIHAARMNRQRKHSMPYRYVFGYSRAHTHIAIVNVIEVDLALVQQTTYITANNCHATAKPPPLPALALFAPRTSVRAGVSFSTRRTRYAGRRSGGVRSSSPPSFAPSRAGP
jgi:hypothetical protein